MQCAECNATIPEVIANAPFCPYCGEEREDVAAAKDGGVGALGVGGGAGASGQTSKREEIFTTSPYDLCLSFDPQLGFAFVGVHAPSGEPARIRAYDLIQKRVLWESLSGAPDIASVENEHLAAHGRNVYVAAGRTLRVLDRATGQPKWGAELTDKPSYISEYGPMRGMLIVDAVPPGQRGAVLLSTVDYVLSSVDHDTGRPVWRETRQHSLSKWWPIEQLGLVILDTTPREVMNPAQQAPLAKLDGRIERFNIEGRYGVWQVENWGWRERDGIVLHDLLANHEVFFEPVSNLEDDVACALGPGRVFCAIESGEKIMAVPHGAPAPVLAGFRVRALKMCGPILFALLEKHHGTGIRRLLGLDPQTLQVRFDLGELTTEPNDAWNHQMASNGEVLAFVTSPNDNDDTCQIMGIHASGRVLWKVDIGEWQSHYFLGGLLVVTTNQGVRLIRPQDGQIVGEYLERW
jgi:hypothetical protein